MAFLGQIFSQVGRKLTQQRKPNMEILRKLAKGGVVSPPVPPTPVAQRKPVVSPEDMYEVGPPEPVTQPAPKIRISLPEEARAPEVAPSFVPFLRAEPVPTQPEVVQTVQRQYMAPIVSKPITARDVSPEPPARPEPKGYWAKVLARAFNVWP